MSWIARFGGAVPLVISVVMLAVGAASAGDVVPIVWNGCEIPHQSGTWKVVDRAASALGEDGTVAVIAVLARGDISDRRNWKTGLLRWSAGTLEILEVEEVDLGDDFVQVFDDVPLDAFVDGKERPAHLSTSGRRDDDDDLDG